MPRRTTNRQWSLHAGIVLIALSCLAACIPASAEEAAVVGQVDRSHPAVGSKFGGRSRALADGTDVHRDEQLWTGAGGRLQVTLSDGAAIALGENARLTLDDFVLPQGGIGRLLIRSVTGAFRFSGGAIDKSAPGAVKIVAPLAVMTVRGTDFFAGPIDGAYGVFVFHGRVEVATAGGSVSLTDGEGTSITKSSTAPGAVKRWGADKIARAEKLVGF